tara:strand:- start:1836 stop:2726 length:891 start_codon:yes stop_codon:yes gene_type:complete
MKYNVGFELCGEIFTNTLVFKKLFSKYLIKSNKNNKNGNIIVRSCLSGDIWNKEIKSYIYWSGENRIPKKSKYENNSIYVITILSKLENSIYIPFCLESHHIYKDRLYKDNIRQYIIGYCASNKVVIRESFFNKCVDKFGIENCISFGACFGKYNKTNKICGGDYQNPGLIKNFSNCKFVIAMENSIGDGYVTEKIVNAFYSGAIPIYWGSSNINDLFNKNAFINVSDFNNLDECIEYISNLSEDDINYMLNQNIYNDNDLINIFNDEYNNVNDNKVLKEYNEKVNNFIQYLYLSQ